MNRREAKQERKKNGYMHTNKSGHSCSKDILNIYEQIFLHEITPISKSFHLNKNSRCTLYNAYKYYKSSSHIHHEDHI